MAGVIHYVASKTRSKNTVVSTLLLHYLLWQKPVVMSWGSLLLGGEASCQQPHEGVGLAETPIVPVKFPNGCSPAGILTAR